MTNIGECLFDPFIAAWTLNPADCTSYTRSELFKKYVSAVTAIPNTSNEPEHSCCIEALEVYLVSVKLYELLRSQKLLDSFRMIEMQIIDVVIQMETCGIYFSPVSTVDHTSIVHKQKLLKKKLSELESKCKSYIPTSYNWNDFNINNSFHISILLFDIISLPVPSDAKKVQKPNHQTNQIKSNDKLSSMYPSSTTSSSSSISSMSVRRVQGHFSSSLSTLSSSSLSTSSSHLAKKLTSNFHYTTCSKVLDQLKHLHPLPEIISEYRTLSIILKRTESLQKYSSIYQQQQQPNKRNNNNKKNTIDINNLNEIHCRWLLTESMSGRIISKYPCLQTIPHSVEFSQNDDGTVIKVGLREHIVAPPRCVLLSADYCQLEMRLMAHFSNDTNLINILQQTDDDVFVSIASTIFGKNTVSFFHYLVKSTSYHLTGRTTFVYIGL
eukprot:TRINITY_DN2215_c0_g1_i1.p2 TRINITY_DN2215_c0_g1~~TRINITY_DN2215_c0_g1_i1.p2  ORF type:complete len:439 (-),score=96.48 TRINITY_DN2215_c0_g1_i1:3198-4514(-)